MTMPMQVSLPLALHLRTPIRYDPIADKTYKPGEKYQDGFEVKDIFTIETAHDRGHSSVVFASILRDIFNHTNWPELHAFFTKRFTSQEQLADQEVRKLSPPEHHARYGKKQEIVHFRTDLKSVGMPSDLTERLSFARRILHSSGGPDFSCTAIGPAIGMAVGAGSYMDLVYCGLAPGKYSGKDNRLEDMIYERQHKEMNIANPPTKFGGRGRTWAEWASLWRVIADWVYEHDSAWLKMGVLDNHGDKNCLGPEEHQKLYPGEKVRMECLSTEAIDAADAIHAVFAQLAERPLGFQGIEWGFLELEVPVQLSNSFYARFGRNPGRDHFSKLVEIGKWYRPDYTYVDKQALKVCPQDYQGASWEAWLLSIEGGDVVVTETLFQALWSVILLTQLPVNIKILEKGKGVPRYRDPQNIYI